MKRLFSTDYGTLAVDSKKITLTTDFEEIEISKRVDVDDQSKAEVVAKAMHDLNGRFEP